MFSYLAQLFRTTWNSIMSLLGFRPKSLPTNELQVFVRTNTGEQVCITFEPSSSVKQIKSDVATRLKSNENSLRIIFAGKELPDNLTMSQCDIGNRSVLHAVRVLTDSSRSQPMMSTNSVNISNFSKNALNDEATDARDKVFKKAPENVPNEVSSSTSQSKLEDIIEANDECGNPTRLLCDDRTVMTIQLSEEELQHLNKIKTSVESSEKPHFYVYCARPCSSVTVGKLRVRCSQCKKGALILHNDPASWNDVLQSDQIKATCEGGCGETSASFYFKCREHETSEDDTSVVLYLIRANLPGVPCLACTDISSPVIVFQCISGHVMCLDCFVIYSLSKLNERQFVSDVANGYTLPCPLACTDSLIKEVHHFKLMGDQNYERYQRFGAEEALLAAGGVLCPQPGCGQGILPDEDCRRIMCIQGCNYVFCRDCLQGYHIGECRSDQGGTSGASTLSSFNFDPDRAARATWDEASNIAIRVLTKPCPKCRTHTERDGGCMHMICTRAQCQFNWCWVCQVEWTRECMAAHWFG